LTEVVARRHLAAEAVAPADDGHLIGGVLKRVDEYRHIQIGPSDRVRDSTLVAEVGQCHQDAVDLVAMRPEEIGAQPRLLERLDRPVVRDLFRGDHRADALTLEHVEYRSAARLAEVMRKESAVADDDAERYGVAVARVLADCTG